MRYPICFNSRVHRLTYGVWPGIGQCHRRQHGHGDAGAWHGAQGSKSASGYHFSILFSKAPLKEGCSILSLRERRSFKRTVAKHLISERQDYGGGRGRLWRLNPAGIGNTPGALAKLAFTQLAVKVSDKNESPHPAIVQAARSQSLQVMSLSMPAQSSMESDLSICSRACASGPSIKMIGLFSTLAAEKAAPGPSRTKAIPRKRRTFLIMRSFKRSVLELLYRPCIDIGFHKRNIWREFQKNSSDPGFESWGSPPDFHSKFLKKVFGVISVHP